MMPTLDLKIVHGWWYPAADAFMANEMKADGSYQRSHLDAALSYVTDFRCAIDGGAHVGTWSRILSGHFERVIAVEPSADTFAALHANMLQFYCANVELHEAALGATAGRVSMVLDGRGLTLANTGARYVTPGGAIPRITIDSLAVPACGFLKLDVEGSELQALQGAKETLARCRPVVLFEDKRFGSRFGEARDATPQFLTSVGYKHVLRSGCDEIWAPMSMGGRR
jgi:FkbM family methyltransferase